MTPQEQILQKLNSPELLEFIKSRLLHQIPVPSEVFKKREAFKDDDGNEILVPPHFNNLTPQQVKKLTPKQKFYKSDGVIAGGAIANLILEYIHGIPATINDIDFFFYNFQAKEAGSVDDEIYERLEGYENPREYRIIKVEEQGILNKVKILPDFSFSWMHLISTFDLTNCQAGYSVYSDQIFFTPEFVTFLETKVIKISPMFDDPFPLSSYLRGIIKARESKTQFYSYDYLRKYLTTNMLERVFEKKITYFKLINHKIASSKNSQEAESYDPDKFEIVTMKRQKVLNDNPNILMPFFKYGGGYIKVNHEELIRYPWYKFFFSLYEKDSKDQDDSFFGNSYKFDSIEDFLEDENFLNQDSAFFDRLLRLFKTPLFSNSYLYGFFEKKPGLFKRDFSANQLLSLSEFLENHTAFKAVNNNLIESYDYSIQDVVDFNVRVKNLSDPHIGLIESYGNRLFSLGKSQNETDKKLHAQLLNKNTSAVFELFDEMWKAHLDKDKLCEEVKTPFGRVISHLYLQSQLTIEGSNMGHCVGGYGPKVKRRESMIFNLKTGKDKSTVEIGFKILKFNRNNEFVKHFVIQHRGPRNSNPKAHHQAMVNRLVNWLNKGYLKPGTDESWFNRKRKKPKVPRPRDGVIPPRKSVLPVVTK